MNYLRKKLALIYSLTLIIIFCSSELANFQLKKSLASDYTEIIHNKFVMGDFKRVILELNNLQTSFSSIQLCPYGQQCFFVFNSEVPSININKPINLSDQAQASISYSYPFGQTIFISLLLWIITILLITPIYLRLDKLQRHRIQLEAKLEINSHLTDMATKLAHDIRSPIEVLEVVSSDISDKDSLLIFEKAVHRLNNIASEILGHRREIQNRKIFQIVDELIKEKEVEYSKKCNISFSYQCIGKDYELSRICPADIKSMISNFINNSVEAAREEVIKINVNVDTNDMVISIKDNGKGIPKEIIQKIGNKNFSYGKEDGNGVGIYFAKQKIESLGKKFKIHSVPNKFTEIKFEFV